MGNAWNHFCEVLIVLYCKYLSRLRFVEYFVWIRYWTLLSLVIHVISEHYWAEIWLQKFLRILITFIITYWRLLYILKSNKFWFMNTSTKQACSHLKTTKSMLSQKELTINTVKKQLNITFLYRIICQWKSPQAAFKEFNSGVWYQVCGQFI